MGPIIWDESFSGGVQKIDQQQKMLIAMINKLIEAQDASIRSETISDIVTRMTGYAQYHFWTKEKLILVPYYTQLPGQGAGRSQEDSRG